MHPGCFIYFVFFFWGGMFFVCLCFFVCFFVCFFCVFVCIFVCLCIFVCIFLCIFFFVYFCVYFFVYFLYFFVYFFVCFCVYFFVYFFVCIFLCIFNVPFLELGIRRKISTYLKLFWWFCERTHLQSISFFMVKERDNWLQEGERNTQRDWLSFCSFVVYPPQSPSHFIYNNKHFTTLPPINLETHTHKKKKIHKNTHKNTKKTHKKTHKKTQTHKKHNPPPQKKTQNR